MELEQPFEAICPTCSIPVKIKELENALRPDGTSFFAGIGECGHIIPNIPEEVVSSDVKLKLKEVKPIVTYPNKDVARRSYLLELSIDLHIPTTMEDIIQFEDAFARYLERIEANVRKTAQEKGVSSEKAVDIYFEQRSRGER